jgi:pyruvate dehydrogenase E2 component (dihydrolipoamide acetyltransferase)
MIEADLREVRVPQLGEGLREARVVELLRRPGAPLKRGDPLYVIETDKTTVEMESPIDCTLVRWCAQVGDVVAIDSTVAMVEAAGGAAEPDVMRHPARRLIPPRTRTYAREQGIDESALEAIPSRTEKLMPDDIDIWMNRAGASADTALRYREFPVGAAHRTLIFRLRRSASVVIPGTVAVDLDWADLQRRMDTSPAPRPTAFQVFGHAVARVAGRNARFRSVMLGDDRLREYESLNVGIAIARPNDELVIAVVRDAALRSLPDFVRECQKQMRLAIRTGDQAREDTQILLTHLGEFGIVDAVPTLVAPANAVFFLGAPPVHGTSVRAALTFDHRIVNGAAAASCLAELKSELAAPLD